MIDAGDILAVEDDLFHATWSWHLSDTPLCICLGKIIAYKEQRSVEKLGQRVSGAVAKIQPRFGIDAFSVPVECRYRGSYLSLIEWNYLDIVIDEHIPETRDSILAVAQSKHRRGLVDIDGGTRRTGLHLRLYPESFLPRAR